MKYIENFFFFFFWKLTYGQVLYIYNISLQYYQVVSGRQLENFLWVSLLLLKKFFQHINRLFGNIRNRLLFLRPRVSLYVDTDVPLTKETRTFVCFLRFQFHYALYPFVVKIVVYMYFYDVTIFSRYFAGFDVRHENVTLFR